VEGGEGCEKTKLWHSLYNSSNLCLHLSQWFHHLFGERLLLDLI